MSRRFNEEQTMCFVRLYRELEPLWNISHPDYKKKGSRIACLEKIIEEMNLSDFSVKDVMLKIRCLRSTYSQEINKIHKSLLENDPDHIYQPSLKWFPDMDYVMKNCGISRAKESLTNIEFSENDMYYLKEEVVATPVEIEILEHQDEANIFEILEGTEKERCAIRSCFKNQSVYNLPSSFRFSEEQTLHFVKLYKESEPLWNVCHPDYKNKSVRKACLQNIIDQMNLSNFCPRDAMMKIKNLRSTYNQELTKMLKSLSENGRDNIYKPTLKWFADMDYVMSKCGRDNTKSSRDLEYSDRHLKVDVFVTAGNEEENLNQPEKSINSNKYGKRTRRNIRRILPKNHAKTSFISEHHQNFAISKISEAIRELTSLTRTLRSQALQNEKVEDECDIVGRHVALQLRELPAAERLAAQLEIQRVLCNCRLKILETNQTMCSST